MSPIRFVGLNDGAFFFTFERVESRPTVMWCASNEVDKKNVFIDVVPCAAVHRKHQSCIENDKFVQ